MSTVKTNTFTGTTSAGSIVVTGEGGSTTTNLQQGLAKCWVKLDGTALSGTGTTGVGDSFNLTSTTDNGAGNYTITMNNDMSSANYSTTVAPNADLTSSMVERTTVMLQEVSFLYQNGLMLLLTVIILELQHMEI